MSAKRGSKPATTAYRPSVTVRVIAGEPLQPAELEAWADRLVKALLESETRDPTEEEV